MFKVTPNPPDTDPAPSHENLDRKTIHETTDRTLECYLNPAPGVKAAPRTPSTMFTINPELDTETLLAHACESRASVNVMAGDLAGFLEGAHRNTLLGIAQVITLDELAVNRALVQLDPSHCLSVKELAPATLRNCPKEGTVMQSGWSMLPSHR